MQHLIISAHPSPESFSNLLVESLAEFSSTLGWEVIVRDLYKTGFDPVLTPDDLIKIQTGQLPEDVEQEQEYLKNADVISLVYPLWWASFPAVLKGWFDRVLTNGFAFKITGSGPVGLLNGKKAFLHTSMGNALEEYEEKGMLKAFRQIHGAEVFGFCGIEVAGHYFYPQIPASSPQMRELYVKKALDSYAAVLHEETSIRYQ